MSHSSLYDLTSSNAIFPNYLSVVAQLNNVKSTEPLLVAEKVNDFVLSPRYKIVSAEQKQEDNLLFNSSIVSFFDRQMYTRRFSQDASSNWRPKESDSPSMSKFNLDCGLSFTNETLLKGSQLFLNRKQSKQTSDVTSFNEEKFTYTQNNLDKLNEVTFRAENTLLANKKRTFLGGSKLLKRLSFADSQFVFDNSLPIVHMVENKLARNRRKSLKLKEIEEENNMVLQSKRVVSKRMQHKYNCEFCELTFANPQAKGGHISKAHGNLPPKYKRKIKLKNKRDKSKGILVLNGNGKEQQRMAE